MLGMLAAAARSRPLTPGLLLITAIILPSTLPSLQALINDCKLEPLPEISTTILLSGWSPTVIGGVQVIQPAHRLATLAEYLPKQMLFLHYQRVFQEQYLLTMLARR